MSRWSMRSTEAAPQVPAQAMHLLALHELQRPESRAVLEDRARARCMVAPVDAVTAVCRGLGRYKYFVDTRDIGLAPHLMLDGYWELWQTEFILNNLMPGQVAADIGAHIGYFTMVMADLVGSTGRVHAFEPNKRLFGLLTANISVNGFPRIVRAQQVGVADHSLAEVPFLVRTRDPKNGCIRPGVAADASDFDAEEYESYTVPAAPLDLLLNGPVDLMKIDVEGAEELVWRGMQQVLDRSPEIRVLLEFNPARCRAPAETLAAIATRFPLRQLNLDGQVTSSDRLDVLNQSEDTILYLSRLEPR